MINTELDIEYLDVQILKAEINNILDSPLQRGDNYQLSHKVTASHLYNLEKQLIRVIVDIEIVVLQNKKKVKAGAKFEIDNYFHYQGLQDYAHIDNSNNKLLIETKFSDIVKGLAYSTARGIVYSKLSGTFLEGTILPTKMSTEV
ncbi:MAG: hypothetical protein ACOYMA_07475 [Bacteroidia bacterium]